VEPLKGASLGLAPPLLRSLTRLEKLARDKGSSLLQRFVTYGIKGYITLASGSIKPFEINESKGEQYRRHDSQHNDTQHNDTLYNNTPW
jgi:hypothetical protein